MLNKNSKTQLWGLVRQESWPQNGYDRKKAQKFSAHASHEILINPNQATTPGTCRDVDLTGQLVIIDYQSLNKFNSFEKSKLRKPFVMNREPDRINEAIFQQPHIFTSPTATESTEDGTEDSIGDVKVSPKVEVKNEEINEHDNGYYQRLGQFFRDINGEDVKPYDGLSPTSTRSTSLSFHDSESGEQYKAPVIHTTIPMREVATSANTWGGVANNPIAVPGLAPEHQMSSALKYRLSNLMTNRPKRNLPPPVYTKMYPELSPSTASSSSSGGSEYLPTDFKQARGNAIYRTRQYTDVGTSPMDPSVAFGKVPSPIDMEGAKSFRDKARYEDTFGSWPVTPPSPNPPSVLRVKKVRPIHRGDVSPGVAKKVAGEKRKDRLQGTERGGKLVKTTEPRVFKKGKRVSASNNNRAKLAYRK